MSARLTEAAREGLRLEAGRRLLADYEAEQGRLADERIAEVERAWPAG